MFISDVSNTQSRGEEVWLRSRCSTSQEALGNQYAADHSTSQMCAVALALALALAHDTTGTACIHIFFAFVPI